MAHIHLFKNNPTAGDIDGTELSQGDGTQPLTAILNANEGESSAQKVAVRCAAGYSIEGACDIYFDGNTADKWAVAPDNDYTNETLALTFGDWQDSMTIGGVSTVNNVFWVRATSSSVESPQNDTSVTLCAEGLVVEING